MINRPLGSQSTHWSALLFPWKRAGVTKLFRLIVGTLMNKKTDNQISRLCFCFVPETQSKKDGQLLKTVLICTRIIQILAKTIPGWTTAFTLLSELLKWAFLIQFCFLDFLIWLSLCFHNNWKSIMKNVVWEQYCTQGCVLCSFGTGVLQFISKPVPLLKHVTVYIIA